MGAKKQTTKLNPLERFTDGMWKFLTESIRKGQLPLAAPTAIVLFMIFKTPGDYFPTLWDKVLTGWGGMACLSYLANLVLVLGWRYHVAAVRNLHEAEIKRLASERTGLQSKVVEVRSSEET